MAKRKAGRPRTYKTAAALRKAVEEYWDSISYQTPVVISTPSGYVDEHGNVEYKTTVLNEKMDGTGAFKLERKFFTPPSTAGLLLHLGISRSTWSEYREKEDLGPVVREWDLRYEAYLVGQLEKGKHVSGVIFNLEHNYGWRHKADITGDGRLKVDMAPELEELSG